MEIERSIHSPTELSQNLPKPNKKDPDNSPLECAAGRGCGVAVSGPSWEHRKTAAWEQFWSISSFIHQLATRAEQPRRPAVTSRYHITLPHCNHNNDLTLSDHSKYFHCIFYKTMVPRQWMESENMNKSLDYKLQFIMTEYNKYELPYITKPQSYND